VSEGTQSREAALGGAARDVIDERRADALTAHRLVHHEGADFGDAAAQGRELRAADDPIAARGHREARRIRLQIIHRPRQEVTDRQVVGDQLMDGLDIEMRGRAQRNRTVHEPDSVAAPSA
jgi:hypothetical protein